MKRIAVRIDSRNRVCLTKVSKKLASAFYIYEEQGRIILEPIIEVPAREAWLFAPENKEILAKVKKGLKQKGIISRGSFASYAKKKSEK